MIDLTGETFGCYTVLSMERINQRTYCNVKCKCGNIRRLSADKVKSKNYQFCNQCKPKTKQLIKDYTGKRFGKLKVVKRVKNKNNKVYYLCLCDCGKQIEVSSTHLQSGHTLSCGCYQKIRSIESNYTHIQNQRFGKLVALYPIREKGSRTKWVCKCDCGNEIVTPISYLTSGRKKSCGCLGSVAEYELSQYFTTHGIQYISQYKFADCKYKRSLPFDFAIFHNDKLIMLIELNGQQHYYPYTFCGENIEKKRSNYEELYLRDKIKSEYCKNHKIPLLVIKYTMFHKKKELFQKQYDELISIS